MVRSRLVHPASSSSARRPARRTRTLSAHLDQTLSEASNELKGNYPASMKDFDQAMGHMLMVADVLSNGISARFPSKFSEAGGKK